MGFIDKFNLKKLPPIGNRLIKTAVAVFICCMIYWIRREQGSLFYFVIAAIFCMQTYDSTSKSSIQERLFGTLNGGVFGCLMLVLNNAALKGLPDMAQYFIWSVSCIFIIYISVLLKQAKVAYFSCAVFYSIVIVHLNDANPYLFAFGRMVDTTIGGMVALFVNQFRIPYKTDNKTLFVCGLDEVLLGNDGELSGYSIFEINRMIEKGALFTIATERSVGEMIEKVKQLRINLPVIAFNGALLFDSKNKTYLRKKVILPQIVHEIKNICIEEKVCCFSTALLEDTLMIYYDRFYHPVEEELYKKLRTSLYRNYISGPISKEADTVYLMCMDKDEHITKLYHRLKKSSIADEIKIVRRVATDYKGYTHLRIYHKDCSKKNMVEELKNMLQVEKAITFGTIQGEYDVLVKGSNQNEVVKKMKKLYEKMPFVKK